MKRRELRAAIVASIVLSPMGAPAVLGQSAPNTVSPSPHSDGAAPPASSPSTPAAKPAEPTHPPAKAATAAVVVGLDTLESIVGKSVRSIAPDEDMGRIIDILVDGTGQPRAVVIDFGGFLGVGSRKVAVDWKSLDFSNSIKSGSTKVSLTRDQVRQSPEYKAGEPVVILEGKPIAEIKSSAETKPNAEPRPSTDAAKPGSPATMPSPAAAPAH